MTEQYPKNYFKPPKRKSHQRWLERKNIAIEFETDVACWTIFNTGKVQKSYYGGKQTYFDCKTVEEAKQFVWERTKHLYATEKERKENFLL